MLAQQLLLFSEYIFNTLEINPAYAGYGHALSLTTMFRKQYSGFKYVFALSDYRHIKPSFLVRGVVGIPLSYYINTNFWIADALGLGVSYRNKSAIVGILDLKLIPELHLGYVYDHSISDFNIISKGSHEVILRYEFSFNRMALSTRYF